MNKKVVKKKHQLKVEKRKTLGRQVKKLRRKGILPANIYGKKVKSLAVQLDLKDFLPIYQEVGETGIVELKVKGEAKVRPVLIHNLQIDPVWDKPLHADFYQVNLKEKVTSNIPIETVGESVIVNQKEGILIQPLTEVEVEALPGSLPDKFEVDISSLKKIGDAITVDDLKPPTGVKVLAAAGEILVKIEPLTKEEVKAPSEEKVEGEAETEGKPAEDKDEKKQESEKPGQSQAEKPAEDKGGEES